MKLSSVTVEWRRNRDRPVHSIEPLAAGPQDQIDDHSPEAVAHEGVICQRTAVAQTFVEARQKFVQEKRGNIAKRPPPIPTEDKQTNFVGSAPICEIIVRRYTRELDAAVGDDYSIIFVVIESIRLLVHFELERVQFGMTESPRTQPDFLTVEVKTLRRGDIGIVRGLCAQQARRQAARKKNDGLALWRTICEEFSDRFVEKPKLLTVPGFLIIHVSLRKTDAQGSI